MNDKRIIDWVDFSTPISFSKLNKIKQLWSECLYLVFPKQELDIIHLENFVKLFGKNLEDPFIKPVNGSKYVAKVLREKDEKSRLFADTWHRDWFHLTMPPKATALYAIEVPDIGGDTLFANQYEAYVGLPKTLKKIVDTHFGINSAKGGYSPEGIYGKDDVDRSMDLYYSNLAHQTQLHPLKIFHPDTKIPILNCNPGYTIGIEGIDENMSKEILHELFCHQTKSSYVFSHKWQKNDLVLWDNRCLLHKATGGYEGKRRLLYRVTIQ